MNIVLIGYRGCGKSTLGGLLAQARGLAFVDTDAVTCVRFGSNSIAEIWQRHGEPAWRKAECDVLDEVLARPGQVVALGGGTVMETRARAALEGGTDLRCLWLQCQPQVLAQRISQDSASRATRPSLTGAASADSLEEILHVLAKREPVYRALAGQILDVTGLNPQEALARVQALLFPKG